MQTHQTVWSLVKFYLRTSHASRKQPAEILENCRSLLSEL
jgi:hypothetical protein